MSSAIELGRKSVRGGASRERILEAAADVAGERGYEGTSINLVSRRSGLPASSIYWHFKDKDELIAAVIDRSFHRWAEALAHQPIVPPDTSQNEIFRLNFERMGHSLASFPDFLRLGLMLILERRPREATARRKFMQVRKLTEERLTDFYRASFADLGETDVLSLARLTLALADGYFIAREADDVDLGSAFDVMASAVLGAAAQLQERASVHP